MTYQRLYELIQKYFESQQIKDQASDVLLDEYLIRVAQLIEAHTGDMDRHHACGSIETGHGFTTEATHAS